MNDGLKIDLYEIDYEVTVKEKCLNADKSDIIQCVFDYDIFDMETYLEDNDKDLCIGYSDCMMEQCNN
jgi:hypothetical protein